MRGVTETALIIGASRGLGLGLARAYAERGWRVIGTVRGAGTGFHALAKETPGRIQVETADITVSDQIAALRNRLADERFALLFVNAGISYGQEGDTVPLGSADAFTRIMLTNAFCPLQVVEAFADLVPATGVIAAMSSGLGSVTNNTRAGWEMYRASKAALNTMLRSFAMRRGDGRTVLAIAPGWVRTDMGGPHAVLDVETSVHGIVDTITARRGQPGAAFVDYLGQHVAW